MYDTKNAPDVGLAAKPWRGRLVASVILLGGLLLVCAAWYFLRPAPPPPPSVDLADGDPEVVRVIQAAREDVLKSPRSGKSWGRFGMVLLAHQFRAEALLALAEAERLDPNEPRWPYLQGVTLEGGEPERAIPKLRRATELSPESTPRLRLAEALLAQGQLDEAEALFGDAERADHGNSRAELGLAQTARARGQLTACVDHLRRVLAIPDAHPKTAHLLLAEVHAQLGDDDKARSERESVLNSPDDAGWADPFTREVQTLRVGSQAQVEKAIDLRSKGEVKEAIALLRRTVQSYPNYDMAWLGLSAALLSDRNYREAESAAREAIRCGPHRFEAHYRLGIALYLQRGKRDHAVADAVKAFRAAIRRAPNVYLAHYRLGVCLQDEDELLGAFEAYRAALRCRPDHAEAHRKLGQLLTAVAEEAAVVGAVQRLLGAPGAVEIAPAIRVQAREHLRTAVRLAPQDAAAQQALDRVGSEVPAD